MTKVTVMYNPGFEIVPSGNPVADYDILVNEDNLVEFINNIDTTGIKRISIEYNV